MTTIGTETPTFVPFYTYDKYKENYRLIKTFTLLLAQYYVMIL